MFSAISRFFYSLWETLILKIISLQKKSLTGSGPNWPFERPKLMSWALFVISSFILGRLRPKLVPVLDDVDVLLVWNGLSSLLWDLFSFLILESHSWAIPSWMEITCNVSIPLLDVLCSQRSQASLIHWWTVRTRGNRPPFLVDS